MGSNIENQRAVRASLPCLVPRTTRIIFLAVKVIRRILHTINQNMVTATRSLRAVSQNPMLAGNRVMEKVTMPQVAFMEDPTVINDRHPTEGTTRVLSNT